MIFKNWTALCGLMISLAGAAALGQPADPPARPPFAPTDSLGTVVAGELGRQMDAVVSAAETLGFSGQVLVAIGGRPALHKAYGFADPAGRRPMTLDTPVGIASISKQFTAAAILEMDVQGRLDLDDTLAEFFEDVPEDKRAITVRHLITHRSGVRSRFSEDFEPNTREELIRGILDTPPAFPPGDRWQYSAAGYNLLAAIIEEVSGAPYEEAMLRLLLDAAGMRASGFLTALPQTGSSVARSHMGWDDRGSPAEWPRNWRNYGAGDMVSTAEDLFRWERALREGRVLSPEARARFFRPLDPVDDETSYGFGLFFHRGASGAQVVEHGGDAALGFNGSFYRYVDEDILILVTCTARSPDGRFLRHAIGEELETLARGGRIELPPPARLPTPAEIERLTGTYRAESGGAFHILTDGAHLWLAAGDPAAASFLDGATGDDAPDLERAVAKTEALLEALLEGDSTAYLTALTEEGRVHFPDYWREWTGWVGSRGPFFGYRVLGARPIGGDVLTSARLRFFQGGMTVTYFWGDRARGRLSGTFAGGTDFRPTTVLALAPLVGGTDPTGGAPLLGRDPLRGTTQVEARIESGPEGESPTLVLRTARGELSAAKVGMAGWVPPLR